MQAFSMSKHCSFTVYKPSMLWLCMHSHITSLQSTHLLFAPCPWYISPMCSRLYIKMLQDNMKCSCRNTRLCTLCNVSFHKWGGRETKMGFTAFSMSRVWLVERTAKTHLHPGVVSSLSEEKKRKLRWPVNGASACTPPCVNSQLIKCCWAVTC